jgi:hypothetical protein
MLLCSIWSICILNAGYMKLKTAFLPLIAWGMLTNVHIAAQNPSLISKSELHNPMMWFGINSYDIAALYSIFYTMHDDPNDKTVKIPTLKQELIDKGIPLLTFAYAKMAYSAQVNEALTFFDEADRPTRSLIVCFVSLSYNRDKVYRMLGGIAGILLLGAIIHKCA